MIVGLAQMNPKVGDFKGNQKKIEAFIASARQQGVELLVFPELSICGYPPKDLLEYPSFVAANRRKLEGIAGLSGDLTIICGFVEENPHDTGPACFNSAALIQGHKIERIYRKQLLPNYNVFDERRYFQPGNETCYFTLASKKIGLTICEDAWNFVPFLQRRHPFQPLDELKKEKPDFVVNISASPFHLGKPEIRRKLFTEAAKFVGAPFVVCNQVGGNDELLFDGCSLAVVPSGISPVKGKVFEEDLIVFDTSLLENPKEAPVEWPVSEGEWLFKALAMGLRDYAVKSGITRAVVGLSGGIDSSVTIAIAAAALGSDSVTGISLPTRYTSRASTQDAKYIADKLDIDYLTFSVDELFESFETVWSNDFGEMKVQTTRENLQPRIRMTVLMAYANEHGRLLLNTSNKSEISTGYATLYGDSAGAISVLGDLTKRQVYEVANYINRKEIIIPSRVIERPPSAELREGQFDEQTLPPYEYLDDMVVKTVELRQGLHELKDSGIPAEHVDTFARLHSCSEYKRYQLPPVLRVSTRAFGVGRRMPIAAGSPLSDW